MSRWSCFLVPFFLALSWVAPNTGDDPRPGDTPSWPQWRGPGRNAVSAETGLLRKWPEEGPEVQWRIAVGAGYSGVSAAAGRLYTMWDEDGDQILVCLDAADGRELWRSRLGVGFQNYHGDGPRSTPLVHGDLVFAIGTQGTLLAANRETGRTIWRHDLVEEYGARLPSYGYASSPLMVGDTLFVETAGREAAYSAFDAGSGELLWSAQDDAPAYSSPIEVIIEGVDQVLFWSAAGVHSVAPESGEELWSHPWTTNCPVTGDPLGTGTPIFLAPDGLFLSSGSGATVIRLSRKGERFEVETVWESKGMRNDVNSSLLLEDHVYGFDGGTFECLDVRTGKAAWKTRDYGKGSLIAADGELIVLGEEGNVALVEATPKAFIEMSNAQVLQGRSWTAPTLFDGKLYLRNHRELVCLNMRE